MPITFLKNIDGKFKELNETGLENYLGFWNSINGSDFDKDGDIDYIVGNIGSNTLLDHQNKEILVYALDFDENKFDDFFPSGYFKDDNGKYKLYPFFTRHEFQKEVIDVRSKFILHEDFGKITFKEFVNIMNTKKLDVSEFKINYFKLKYIIVDENLITFQKR